MPFAVIQRKHELRSGEHLGLAQFQVDLGADLILHSKASRHSIVKCNSSSHARSDADRVANEISPEKSEPQHQLCQHFDIQLGSLIRRAVYGSLPRNIVQTIGGRFNEQV